MISTTKLLAALAPEVANALADDDGDGIAEPGVVEAALARGETSVREALAAAGYAPGATLPEAMEDLAVVLAIEALLLRRRELLPGPWKERADRARKVLDEIVMGRRAVDGVGHRPRVVGVPDEPAGARRRSTLRGL